MEISSHRNFITPDISAADCYLQSVGICGLKHSPVVFPWFRNQLSLETVCLCVCYIDIVGLFVYDIAIIVQKLIVL